MNLKKNITKHRIFVFLLLAYFLYLLFFSISRHQSFHSTGLDLAVFDQLFWNTIHGRFWEFSLELGKANPHSYFSNHFSPILFLVIPFYKLVPLPETLLTLQATALAVGAVPIYLFALETLKSIRKAIFVSSVYFLSPFILNINLFDFHEVSFFVPLFGFCLLFMFQERWNLFWTFLLLSLAVKEEIGLIGFALGLFLMFKKKVGLGIAVASVSLAWSFLAIKFLIPHFANGDYKFASYRYLDFGTSAGEIVKNILLDPVKDLIVVLQLKKVYFLAILLGSVGFVSLLGGSLLIVLLVPLLYLLLASYPAHYSYTAQYSAVLIPTLLFLFVIGLRRIERFGKGVYILVAVVVLVETLLFGALPFSRKFDWKTFRMDSRYSTFAAIKSKIDPESSLAASDFVISHLAQRRWLEFYSEGSTADYIFLDGASFGFDNSVQESQVKNFISRGYRIVERGDGLLLLSKK